MSFKSDSNKDGHQSSRRIESEVMIDRNSLIIGQNFCLNTLIGSEKTLLIEKVTETDISIDEDTLHDESLNASNEIVIQQEYTLVYAAPIETIRSAILMTVIAKNLSENDVLISIEDADETFTEEVVPAKSELAITVHNGVCIRALAIVQSRVQFFVSVFYSTNSL